MITDYTYYALFCTDPAMVPKPPVMRTSVPSPELDAEAGAVDFGGYTFDLTSLFKPSGDNLAPEGPPDVVPQAVADPGNPPADPALWNDYYNNETKYIEYGADQEIYGQYQGDIDTDNDGKIDVSVTLPEDFDPTKDPSVYLPTPPGPPPPLDAEDYQNQYNTWLGKFTDWKTKYHDYAIKKYWHDTYIKEAYEAANQKMGNDIMTNFEFNLTFEQKHKKLMADYLDCLFSVMNNAAEEQKSLSKAEAAGKAREKKTTQRMMQRANQDRKAIEQRFIQRMASGWRSAAAAKAPKGKGK